MFKQTVKLLSGLANKTRNTLNSTQKASQRKRMRQVDANIYNIREGLRMKVDLVPETEARQTYWNALMKEHNFIKYFNPEHFKPEQTCTPLMKYFYVSKKSKNGYKSMNWARFKTKTSINRESPYEMLPNRAKITHKLQNGEHK
ncbi:hypothetical protein FOG51_02329 [Hanseniaspora uvarum]|jgi:hypothetical protein|nr:hypothetical protein FOG48_03907 [Hanseniaspora uvarum]KAF0272605.1 hypothetical protein FOG51_02329 [Hanseniaspora uvarum]KAF0277817.1 hypothetical protein FOG50_01344 [Hanseniaspora uvarum]GMM40266.1 hypothetical protein DAHU10_011670 [Hanseniaspora uvarum]